MISGRSFQQNVTLLSLRKTLKEAEFGADKANALMKMAPVPQLPPFSSHLHMCGYT